MRILAIVAVALASAACQPSAEQRAVGAKTVIER
jgi:hypothetical protein